MHLYAFLQGVSIKRSYPQEAVVPARTGAQWEACLHSDVTTSKAESVRTQFWFRRIKKKKREHPRAFLFILAWSFKQPLFKQYESSSNQIRQNHIVAWWGRCKSPSSRASHGMPAEWDSVWLSSVCHHSCVGTLKETLALCLLGCLYAAKH